jgi:hypothetical protein
MSLVAKKMMIRLQWLQAKQLQELQDEGRGGGGGGGGWQYMPNKPRKFIEIVAEMFEN